MKEYWVDIVAIVLSTIALIFSFMQFKSERERSRKEATIHAFDELQNSESIIYLFSLSKIEIDDLVCRYKNKDQRINGKWDMLKKALPLIEHFAVGVNSEVYDVYTLNRMAGNKIITVYEACEVLIEYKRSGKGDENNYLEFEKMVKSLKRIRSK